MRDSTKRVAVAIAGVAIAGGAALAAAPAADAATVTSRAATLGASAPSTAVAGHEWDEWDDDCGRARCGYRPYRKWQHPKWYQRGQWREYGRYRTYREAWLIGQRYRGDWWESYDCDEDGGWYVLRVY